MVIEADKQTLTKQRYNSKFVYCWKLIKLKFLSYLSDNFSVSQQIIKISAQFNYPIHLFFDFTAGIFTKSDVTEECVVRKELGT